MKCTGINHELVVPGSAEAVKVKDSFCRTGKKVY